MLGVQGGGTTTVTDWVETGASVTVPFGPSADGNVAVVARLPVTGGGQRSYAGQAGMRIGF
jgi:hypothetical protein